MMKGTFIIISILCSALLSATALAQDPGGEGVIDAKADRVLKEMSEYLTNLEQFNIQAESSFDMILDNGQKIQMGRSVDVSVRRPDRLRVDIDGDMVKQRLFYDGKQITLYGKKVNYYATTKAPSTIEAAMDYAEKSFRLVTPAADLIDRNSYGILTEDISSGSYIGLSTLSGVECHHLAFRAEETDWQIWIENSKTPLPRKFIITSKWTTGAPQFIAMLNTWDLSPELEDSRFIFTAPEEAEKIDFLTSEN